MDFPFFLSLPCIRRPKPIVKPNPELQPESRPGNPANEAVAAGQQRNRSLPNLPRGGGPNSARRE